MPLKSKAQMKYLFANAPKLGKEFADNTTNIKSLPERVQPKGFQKNKPVTAAFKKKTQNALSSYE